MAKYEFVGKSLLKEASGRSQPNFQFVGKALWFSSERTLVIADLHMGYEESLNSAGVYLPRTQFKDSMDDLKKVFEKIGKVKEIVILGDLKHEFGKILEQEWRETIEVLDFLQEKGRVALVKGNHDSILEPIARKNGIKVVDFYEKDGIFFMHGHKLFPEALGKEVKTIVLGHRHPAVVISDKYKSERYKCFLVGKWKGKEVIVLPSFFPFIEGSEISIDEGKFIIPEPSLKNFEAYVVGDEVYKFGKVGRLI